MINIKTGKLPTNSLALTSQIIREQGASALWRGNMPKFYHSSMQMFMRVLTFDKFKHMFMPYDSSKYIGFDYFWRVAIASVLCNCVTLMFTYPFDMIHTRTCTDMARKNTTRLYTTTFDCFNRINLDETRRGLFKGAEIALISSMLRAIIQLPIYSTVKKVMPQDDTMMGRFSQRLGTSMVAGSLVTLLVYPLDTIKKTAQCSGGRGYMNTYNKLPELMVRLPQAIGLRGVYKGWHLFLLTSVISSYTQF